MNVSRLSIWCEGRKSWTGDYLTVGGQHLDLRQMVQLEYERAKKEHPDNPAFHMRPMFYTGSPYGAEIMALMERRGSNGMTKWQPIETAPKDGTRVLVYCPGQTLDGEPREVCEARLGTYRDWGDPVYQEWECQSNPTHWMPLPNPPNEP